MSKPLARNPRTVSINSYTSVSTQQTLPSDQDTDVISTVKTGPKALGQNQHLHQHNTANGFCALEHFQEAESSAFGSHCLSSLTHGQGNNAMGTNALRELIHGHHNTAFGFCTCQLNQASHNTGFGSSTLRNNITGSENTGYGSETMPMLHDGSRNGAFGFHSGYQLTGGDDNCLYGHNAQSEFTGSVSEVTTYGSGSLQHNEKSGNCAFGSFASNQNTEGECNTAQGTRALEHNVLGSRNSASGFHSLRYCLGSENTMFGNQTMCKTASSGNQNAGFGNRSLFKNIASCNAAMGNESLRNNTLGQCNSALGNQAGIANVTGSHNTYLGDNAGPSLADLDDTICLGSGATADQSNQLVIGSESHPVLVIDNPPRLQPTTKFLQIKLNGQVMFLPLFIQTGSDLFTTSNSGSKTADLVENPQILANHELPLPPLPSLPTETETVSVIPIQIPDIVVRSSSQ